MAKQVWMVRAGDSEVCDQFEQIGYVGIYFDVDENIGACSDKKELETWYRTNGKSLLGNSFSQTAKFLFDIDVGEVVVTYHKARREYLVGEICGPYAWKPELRRPGTKPVKWTTRVARDSLSQTSKNSLGSLLTVFVIPPSVAGELLGAAVVTPGRPDGSPIAQTTAEDDLSEVEAEAQAHEFIKDEVVKLNWDQMQDLVAGILRAMGYKTRTSPPGSDRGRDIIASPDGLGLSDPRIVAEVKHRDGAMGAPQVRNFIATLRGGDRGLYVSTGGFSREARYEADRAAQPVTLVDLDELVELLVEHYDSADTRTTALVPLRPIYWPASRQLHSK